MRGCWKNEEALAKGQHGMNTEEMKQKVAKESGAAACLWMKCRSSSIGLKICPFPSPQRGW